MLNASKILLLLPDVAFAAELLPGKQPNSFSIQTCSQYLSPFLEGSKFNSEKLFKLFKKLETDEPYALVLPDSLFFNKIVSVSKESDSAIKDELKGSILPSLNLDSEIHEIITTVLNQHKGETRIQISALAKSVLGPVRAVAEKAGVAVESVTPLSFALKSIISLEPSVSAVQLGDSLYIAQHYIGISDCQQVPVTDTQKAVEIITEFKKNESSTMTVYALTNPLIGSQLKEGLKQIVPLQQMSEVTEGSKLPGAVTTTIESVARSLSITDFPIPLFNLGKASREELDALVVPDAADDDADELDDDSSESATVSIVGDEPQTDGEVAMSKDEKLPTEKAEDTASVTKEAGETKEGLVEKAAELTTEENVAERIEDLAETVAVSDLPKPSSLGGAAAVAAAAKETANDGPAIKLDALSELKSETAEKTEIAVGKVKDLEDTMEEKVAVLGNKAESTVDLSTLTKAQSGSSTDTVKPVQSKDGGRNMTKMILTTLGVFLVTLAVGVGIGFFLINQGKNADTETPTVTVEPTPAATPEATPAESEEASASAQLGNEEKAAVSILVVNATSKAGYAGTIRTRLVNGGFTKATAGNAGGEYGTAGNFVFMKEGSTALRTSLESAMQLELTEDADLAEAEDAEGTYDVIIVLNE